MLGAIDHVGVVVDDLDETVRALAALGVETTAARASGGRRTCWSVPSTTDGVLYQFLEVDEQGS